MGQSEWVDLGAVEELRNPPVRSVRVDRLQLAVSYLDGRFGVISNACNHVGGPLGEGRLDGEYVVCPWHAYYKFHFATGLGEPGFEEDKVPGYQTRIEGGRLLVDLASATKRNKVAHEPHPLSRKIRREEGPLRRLHHGSES